MNIVFFWIWFVFMIVQLVYVGIYKTLKWKPLKWNQLGWFSLGLLDAYLTGLLLNWR